MGKERFLEAGCAEASSRAEAKSVRPVKGLSHDVVETVHGEIVPLDEGERNAEMERVDLPEDARESMEEEVEEEMEEAPVNARRAPREPTEEERRRHEASHLPYRSWCEYCVKGRGRCRPHQRRKGEVEEHGLPTISMDYFFLGGEEMEASEHPMLVMLDEDRGNRYARMVDAKGLDEGGEWILIDMAEEIKSWIPGGAATDPQK